MYRLESPFTITAAQQEAVDRLAAGFRAGSQRQVLLGVTGSGKTFTMAHLVRALDAPALVLSPNKTLAAQLYQEFRSFFPHDRVGYFISYYDYYQPEAYVPQKNLYIAKEVSINPELERLRIDATRHLLESPRTVIVASVSAIYSIGAPDEFFAQRVPLAVGAPWRRENLLAALVELGYGRGEGLIESGRFRARGDRVEVWPSSEEEPLRLELQGDRLNAIAVFDPVTGRARRSLESVNVFPISYFFSKRDKLAAVIPRIRQELDERLAWFRRAGQPEYAQRLRQKTLLDLEMLEQFGHCAGIENYSLYLTGRQPGEAPFTLLDFFPRDFLTVIDESHITVPQLRGMFAGDRSRKQKLVDYGFRLPSALDNRPLQFSEIQARLGRTLYVSATPDEFEVADSGSRVTELLVRPTGLLDPEVELRRGDDPVQDLIGEIRRVAPSQRVLVTTLTKKMAEKLAGFIALQGFRCTYLHSEIKALERIKVIQQLRRGDIQVLIGINLLREGLDLPEVALVAILDADQEGFLRSPTSLIQTFGRAARNLHGRVLLYARAESEAIRRAISESDRRRRIQADYNRRHRITPASIAKGIHGFADDGYWLEKSAQAPAEDFKTVAALEREIARVESEMKRRARALDFKTAAALRDRLKSLKNLLLEMD